MSIYEFVKMLDGGINEKHFAFKLLEDHVITEEHTKEILETYIKVVSFFQATLTYDEKVDPMVGNHLNNIAQDYLEQLQMKLEDIK